MREELAEIIQYESADPRLEGVQVTDVIPSPDFKKVDVLVLLPKGEAERGRALEGLQHAAPYFRAQLMQRLDLFRMPELRFRPAVESSGDGRLEHLKRRVRRGRPRDGEES
jgi:ribosome-binding factor A